MSAPSCPLCGSQSFEWRRQEVIMWDDTETDVDVWVCWSCLETFDIPVYYGAKPEDEGDTRELPMVDPRDLPEDSPPTSGDNVRPLASDEQ